MVQASCTVRAYAHDTAAGKVRNRACSISCFPWSRRLLAPCAESAAFRRLQYRPKARQRMGNGRFFR